MSCLSDQEYLKEAIDFLCEFNWLFRESNTRFLKNGVLDHLPRVWCNVLIENSYNLPDGASLPDSLIAFIAKCKKLSCRSNEISKNSENKCVRIRGVSPKKLHEILNLTAFIKTKLFNAKDLVLVDLGSGSGYVTQQLYASSQYRLLGIEANDNLVKSARQRQEKYFPASKRNVKYAQHFITQDSADFIENKVTDEFTRSHTLALFGLHSCGDLSITAISLFFQMPRVQSLIIMPCCYHKLKFSTGLQFTNFPRSQYLKAIFQGIEDYENIFNRPFLRLACQETAARWRDTNHSQHGRKMFERALAEAIIDDNEQCVRAKVKSENSSLEHSFENIQAQYDLVDKATHTPLQWKPSHRHKCDELLATYPNGDQLAECLTYYQSMLQEICEQVVLKDRLCYADEVAQEQGATIEASIVQIVDDKLSPRCYAFVLEKPCL